MKCSGIVRRVDELGRVVVPKEIRSMLGVNPHNQVEIYVEDDCIVLRKHEPSCIFCDSDNDLVSYGEKKVCKSCIDKIKGLM